MLQHSKRAKRYSEKFLFLLTFPTLLVNILYLQEVIHFLFLSQDFMYKQVNTHHLPPFWCKQHTIHSAFCFYLQVNDFYDMWGHYTNGTQFLKLIITDREVVSSLFCYRQGSVNSCVHFSFCTCGWVDLRNSWKLSSWIKECEHFFMDISRWSI